MRMPLELPRVAFTCLRANKEKRMIQKGMNLINKELEVDQFLKGQMKMKIALKALFSKLERFLIRKNKMFVISTEERSLADTDDVDQDHSLR